MQKDIIIKGAREHNLKNLDVTIPRGKLTVITGLSGSGKSTLAFDTIYAEGQRRYVESLSSYARQFLGLMSKPDVDSIEGLSPAISIEQKTTSKNPRSTVGTVTEIYDYLRLLYARVGTPHCPKCGKIIQSQTADQITNQILKLDKQKIQILSPIIRQKKGTYEKVIENIKSQGFTKVRVNKAIYNVDDEIKLDRYKKHNIEIVIDRINYKSSDDKSRIQEAIELAIKLSDEGLVILLDQNDKEKMYSSKGACVDCGINFEELQPRMFSFNSPFGACVDCSGLGIKQEFDPDLIIPDRNLSIADGAIKPFKSMDGWRIHQFSSVAKAHKFSVMTPVKDLKKSEIEAILHGTDKKIKFRYESNRTDNIWEYSDTFEGVIPMLERLYKQTESERRRQEMDKFIKKVSCQTCKGKRLKDKILAVKINDKSIIDITDMSIDKSVEFFKNIKLNDTQQHIAKQVLKEINERLQFLHNVGLDYLNLSRTASTLSGGEAQRIRLATQIGSNLTGVLYVLDEPSIGLHQRDNHKLIETLKKLRDLGNTLIVVEHDEDTILNADHVIDIGPGAGIHGGHITSQGTPEEILKDKNSLTGQYLSKQKEIQLPKKRRASTEYIELKGATRNNLKNVNLKIPINTLTSITGVSGSGKSSLINETLRNAIKNYLNKTDPSSKLYKSLTLPSKIDKLIIIDQEPIGKTPRSNPATYTKIFDEVRTLFSKTQEAKKRGYQPGRFSFNVKGGRCENCSGDGLIKIEMNFLPDVYVTCEECKGKRYNSETLQVTYKNKNIADVLNMTVEEALEFFSNIPSLKRKLETLFDVGLTYIKLGQASTTLSGGEAQRIKLTRELSKRDLGHTVYILDEPTTGLHFEDVKKLLDVLNRLVDKKNTVIVIEHNMDVIKTSDYIVDLGPEGGQHGGQIIAEGTPEEIIKNKKSYTGQFLKPHIL